MRVYNGEDVAITVVTDGNPDVTIQPKSFAEVSVTEDAVFNSDAFYVENQGSWYAAEAGHTGADLEIYSEGSSSNE